MIRQAKSDSITKMYKMCKSITKMTKPQAECMMFLILDEILNGIFQPDDYKSTYVK